MAVQSSDIAASVRYYVDSYGAEILYQDATWAIVRLGQGKLAIVTPSQHPAHVAFRVDEATLEREAAKAELPVDTHRDGTKGIYVSDPDGHVVELICYPPGETVYAKKEAEAA